MAYLGFRHSDESKEKIRQARLGTKLSEEHKRKISEGSNPVRYWLGKKFSEEHKMKLSSSHQGMRRTEEWKKKISQSHIGLPKNTKHLKRYQFKKGQIAHNKGVPNYDIRGGKHPNWKGGITPVNRLERISIEYKKWRTAVFERDNYTCVNCGIKSGKGKKVVLHADHIKRFADYPKLRYELNNGRTLCIDCHRKTDTWGHK
jgi:5-methylcytosine-specific restriction endonuclease McrA